MISPILILVSEDTYLINRELQSLQKKVKDSGLGDFNLDRFSAKENKIDEILGACNTLPMMADSRLVLVWEAEHFKKDDLEKLAAYFASPSRTTELVLIASKIDKRLKCWQAANKSNWIKELKPPYPNQLPQWITKEAVSLGLKIDLQASQMMADSIGLLLMAQVQALEKLKLYIHPKTQIEAHHVEEIIGGFLTNNVFAFTEKVGLKNFKEATHLLDQMITAGEPLVRLTFMMIRHFRLLLKAGEGLEEKWAEKDFAQNLGVNPFFVKDYISQAKKLSPTKLRQIYQNLLDTDRALKFSPLDSRLVMDRFLMKTCLEPEICRFGCMKGKGHVGKEFFEPLTDEDLPGFGL